MGITDYNPDFHSKLTLSAVNLAFFKRKYWLLNTYDRAKGRGDKSEQLQLINELDEEEKSILLKLIETFVSKKRFKDFVQQNIAAL